MEHQLNLLLFCLQRIKYISDVVTFSYMFQVEFKLFFGKQILFIISVDLGHKSVLNSVRRFKLFKAKVVYTFS